MRIMDIDRPKKASFIKTRLLIVILATLCPVICYMSRQNLSLAIVSMVNSNPEDAKPTVILTTPALNGTHSSQNVTSSIGDAKNHVIEHKNSCPATKVVDIDGNELPAVLSYGPKYNWSASDRSLLFETFFFTYMLCQIPGARMAEVMGAKWILATAAFGSALLSLLSPLAASMHVYAFALIRALMGICQTAIFPSCYVLYTRWLPPKERRQALPLLVAGVYLGSIVASAATGYFSEQEALGWPWAFYMPSVLCFIWGIVWVFFGASEPREHWFISLEEIDDIESKMETKKTTSLDGQVIKKSPSWKKIFSSQTIWAMMFVFFASNWAMTTFLLLIPTYLNDILLVPPFRNGLINSMIYILYIITSPIVGAVSSIMVESRTFGFTRLQTRKFFESIAIFSQAICFLSLPFIGCNTQIVLGLLYVQIVLFTFNNGGEIQLPTEISLDFAGTIFAIGNCVGSATGFMVPRVHSLIVTNTHDRDQWNTYFYTAASVTTIGGMIFLFYGKNDLEDFSKSDGNDKSPQNAHRLTTDSIYIHRARVQSKAPAQISI